PVYFDGGGPMPGFFYRGPLPDLAEYNQHQLQYDLRFLFPYCIASVILTLVCLFAAPALGDRFIRRRNVGVYSAISLVLIFAVAAVSDVANTIWLKDAWFYGSHLDSYIRLLIVGLPLAVSSALLAVAVRRPSSKA